MIFQTYSPNDLTAFRLHVVQNFGPITHTLNLSKLANGLPLELWIVPGPDKIRDNLKTLTLLSCIRELQLRIYNPKTEGYEKNIAGWQFQERQLRSNMPKSLGSGSCMCITVGLGPISRALCKPDNSLKLSTLMDKNINVHGELTKEVSPGGEDSISFDFSQQELANLLKHNGLIEDKSTLNVVPLDSALKVHSGSLPNDAHTVVESKSQSSMQDGAQNSMPGTIQGGQPSGAQGNEQGTFQSNTSKSPKTTDLISLQRSVQEVFEQYDGEQKAIEQYPSLLAQSTNSSSLSDSQSQQAPVFYKAGDLVDTVEAPISAKEDLQHSTIVALDLLCGDPKVAQASLKYIKGMIHDQDSQISVHESGLEALEPTINYPKLNAVTNWDARTKSMMGLGVKRARLNAEAQKQATNQQVNAVSQSINQGNECSPASQNQVQGNQFSGNQTSDNYNQATQGVSIQDHASLSEQDSQHLTLKRQRDDLSETKAENLSLTESKAESKNKAQTEIKVEAQTESKTDGIPDNKIQAEDKSADIKSAKDNSLAGDKSETALESKSNLTAQAENKPKTRPVNTHAMSKEESLKIIAAFEKEKDRYYASNKAHNQKEYESDNESSQDDIAQQVENEEELKLFASLAGLFDEDDEFDGEAKSKQQADKIETAPKFTYLDSSSQESDAQDFIRVDEPRFQDKVVIVKEPNVHPISKADQSKQLATQVATQIVNQENSAPSAHSQQPEDSTALDLNQDVAFAAARYAAYNDTLLANSLEAPAKAHDLDLAQESAQDQESAQVQTKVKSDVTEDKQRRLIEQHEQHDLTREIEELGFYDKHDDTQTDSSDTTVEIELELSSSEAQQAAFTAAQQAAALLPIPSQAWDKQESLEAFALSQENADKLADTQEQIAYAKFDEDGVKHYYEFIMWTVMPPELDKFEQSWQGQMLSQCIFAVVHGRKSVEMGQRFGFSKPINGYAGAALFLNQNVPEAKTKDVLALPEDRQVSFMYFIGLLADEYAYLQRYGILDLSYHLFDHPTILLPQRSSYLFHSPEPKEQSPIILDDARMSAINWYSDMANSVIENSALGNGRPSNQGNPSHSSNPGNSNGSPATPHGFTMPLGSLMRPKLNMDALAPYNRLAAVLYWALRRGFTSVAFNEHYPELLQNFMHENFDLRLFIKKRLNGQLQRWFFSIEIQFFLQLYYDPNNIPNIHGDFDAYALSRMKPEEFVTYKQPLWYVPYDQQFVREVFHILNVRFQFITELNSQRPFEFPKVILPKAISQLLNSWTNDYTPYLKLDNKMAVRLLFEYDYAACQDLSEQTFSVMLEIKSNWPRQPLLTAPELEGNTQSQHKLNFELSQLFGILHMPTYNEWFNCSLNKETSLSTQSQLIAMDKNRKATNLVKGVGSWGIAFQAWVDSNLERLALNEFGVSNEQAACELQIILDCLDAHYHNPPLNNTLATYWNYRPLNSEMLLALIKQAYNELQDHVDNLLREKPMMSLQRFRACAATLFPKIKRCTELHHKLQDCLALEQAHPDPASLADQDQTQAKSQPQDHAQAKDQAQKQNQNSTQAHNQSLTQDQDKNSDQAQTSATASATASTSGITSTLSQAHAPGEEQVQVQGQGQVALQVNAPNQSNQSNQPNQAGGKSKHKHDKQRKKKNKPGEIPLRQLVKGLDLDVVNLPKQITLIRNTVESEFAELSKQMLKQDANLAFHMGVIRSQYYNRQDLQCLLIDGPELFTLKMNYPLGDSRELIKLFKAMQHEIQKLKTYVPEPGQTCEYAVLAYAMANQQFSGNTSELLQIGQNLARLAHEIYLKLQPLTQNQNKAQAKAQAGSHAVSLPVKSEATAAQSWPQTAQASLAPTAKSASDLTQAQAQAQQPGALEGKLEQIWPLIMTAPLYKAQLMRTAKLFDTLSPVLAAPLSLFLQEFTSDESKRLSDRVLSYKLKSKLWMQMAVAEIKRLGKLYNLSASWLNLDNLEQVDNPFLQQRLIQFKTLAKLQNDNSINTWCFTGYELNRLTISPNELMASRYNLPSEISLTTTSYDAVLDQMSLKLGLKLEPNAMVHSYQRAQDKDPIKTQVEAKVQTQVESKVQAKTQTHGQAQNQEPSTMTQDQAQFNAAPQAETAQLAAAKPEAINALAARETLKADATGKTAEKLGKVETGTDLTEAGFEGGFEAGSKTVPYAVPEAVTKALDSNLIIGDKALANTTLDDTQGNIYFRMHSQAQRGAKYELSSLDTFEQSFNTMKAALNYDHSYLPTLGTAHDFVEYCLAAPNHPNEAAPKFAHYNAHPITLTPTYLPSGQILQSLQQLYGMPINLYNLQDNGINRSLNHVLTLGHNLELTVTEPLKLTSKEQTLEQSLAHAQSQSQVQTQEQKQASNQIEQRTITSDDATAKLDNLSKEQAQAPKSAQTQVAQSNAHKSEAAKLGAAKLKGKSRKDMPKSTAKQDDVDKTDQLLAVALIADQHASTKDNLRAMSQAEAKAKANAKTEAKAHEMAPDNAQVVAKISDQVSQVQMQAQAHTKTAQAAQANKLQAPSVPLTGEKTGCAHEPWQRYLSEPSQFDLSLEFISYWFNQEFDREFAAASLHEDKKEARENVARKASLANTYPMLFLYSYLRQVQWSYLAPVKQDMDKWYVKPLESAYAIKESLEHGNAFGPTQAQTQVLAQIQAQSQDQAQVQVQTPNQTQAQVQAQSPVLADFTTRTIAPRPAYDHQTEQELKRKYSFELQPDKCGQLDPDLLAAWAKSYEKRYHEGRPARLQSYLDVAEKNQALSAELDKQWRQDEAKTSPLVKRLISQRHSEAAQAGLNWKQKIAGQGESNQYYEREFTPWKAQPPIGRDRYLVRFPFAEPWNVWCVLTEGKWSQYVDNITWIELNREWFIRFGAKPREITENRVIYKLQKRPNQTLAGLVAEQMFSVCPNLLNLGNLSQLATYLTTTDTWMLSW